MAEAMDEFPDDGPTKTHGSPPSGEGKRSFMGVD
jgi:hypothetical protein